MRGLLIALAVAGIAAAAPMCQYERWRGYPDAGYAYGGRIVPMYTIAAGSCASMAFTELSGGTVEANMANYSLTALTGIGAALEIDLRTRYGDSAAHWSDTAYRGMMGTDGGMREVAVSGGNPVAISPAQWTALRDGYFWFDIASNQPLEVFSVVVSFAHRAEGSVVGISTMPAAVPMDDVVPIPEPASGILAGIAGSVLWTRGIVNSRAQKTGKAQSLAGWRVATGFTRKTTAFEDGPSSCR